MIFQFNQISLDTAQYRLCLSGKPVSVEPQVFDLLVYLLENRERVVTRDELLDKLWKGKIVTDAALGVRLKEARKAVQDDGTKQEVIKTVHGRGYQFIAEVSEYIADESAALAVKKSSRKLRQHSKVIVVSLSAIVLCVTLLWVKPWDSRDNPASLQRMAFPLPDKPSIAVLAFDNLSGEHSQEYLCDGISEGIISELSRFPQLFVIARNSSFTYKGRPVKIQTVSEELGVRYVVEGSLQSSDSKIRVTAQLIDATSGEHLWSERFDGERQDFFAVQDEITRVIVATLAGRVELVERTRAVNNPAGRLLAYQYVQQGWAQWYKWTREANDQARELYQKALQLDPDYAEAYVGLTFVNFNNMSFGSAGLTHDESLDLAFKSALQAAQIDPHYYRSHLALANVHLRRGDLRQANAEYEKALELNPNATKVLASAAEVLVQLGRAQEAVVQIKLAMRLNPYHPDWYLWNLGWAQYFAGDHEEALTSLRRMRNPPNAVKRTLAVVLARLGRLDESRRLGADFLKGKPDYSFTDFMKNWHFKDHSYLAKLIEDLDKVGLAGGRI